MIEKTFHLRLTNGRECNVNCILEPWGDSYLMVPGESFEIVFEARGEEDVAAPEIVGSDEALTIYAGRMSSFWIKRDGKEVHAAGWPREAEATAPLLRAA